MADSIFAPGSDTVHYVVVGTSGRGRSVFLEEEARRRGLSYDEFLASIEPTAEQKAAAKVVEDARREKRLEQEAKRLHAVRVAYLEHTSDDELESELADTVFSLSAYPGGFPIPRELLEAAFHLLPDVVIGNGIRWGFSDTEVRDSVFSYLEKDEDGRVKALFEPMKP